MNIAIVFPIVLIFMLSYHLYSGKIRWRGSPAIWTKRREEPILYWLFIGVEACLAFGTLYLILHPFRFRLK
jgi:hypothetical protein